MVTKFLSVYFQCKIAEKSQYLKSYETLRNRICNKAVHEYKMRWLSSYENNWKKVKSSYCGSVLLENKSTKINLKEHSQINACLNARFNKFLEYLFLNLIFLEQVYAFLPCQLFNVDSFIVDVFKKKTLGGVSRSIHFEYFTVKIRHI